jgi:hypothetical protein
MNNHPHGPKTGNVERLEVLLENLADLLKQINQCGPDAGEANVPAEMLPRPSIILDDALLANARLEMLKEHGLVDQDREGFIVPAFQAQPRAYILDRDSGTMILVIPPPDEAIPTEEILQDIADAALLGEVECFLLVDDEVVEIFSDEEESPLTSLSEVETAEDLCDLFDGEIVKTDSKLFTVAVFGDDEAPVFLTPSLEPAQLDEFIRSDAGRGAINELAADSFDDWDAAEMGWTAPDDGDRINESMQQFTAVGRRLIDAGLLATPGSIQLVEKLESTFGTVELPPGIDPDWLAFVVPQIVKLAAGLEEAEGAANEGLTGA